MEWILVTGYTFLFIALILKVPGFKVLDIPPAWLVAVFSLKVLCGIALGLTYTYIYTDRSTSDTFKFFDDSKIIFNSLSTNPYDFLRMFTGFDGNAPELRHYYVQMNAWLNTDVMFNDNKTIIRLNVLFHFFSMGKYYVHVVFINFISFIGLFCIFKTFQSCINYPGKILFAGTFLLPSVMFWGSGLLKDGLLLFALGILLVSFKRILLEEKSIKNIIMFFISITLLVFTKLYVIIILFPGLLAWYWSRNESGIRVFIKFCAVYLLYLVLAFNIHHIAPKYNVTDLVYWKQKNFNTLAELTNAKSVIKIPQLEHGIISIIKNSPVAFLTALSRPFLTDIKGNFLILLSALETVFILMLCFLAILFRKKANVPIKPFLVFSFFFVLLLFTLSGLITPILGALVRYKVPALPFLMFLILPFIDFERLMFWKKRIVKNERI